MRLFAGGWGSHACYSRSHGRRRAVCEPSVHLVLKLSVELYDSSRLNGEDFAAESPDAVGRICGFERTENVDRSEL